MTEYTINIEDNDVLVRVYNQTANAALQRGDALHVATEDNKDIITQFITEGKKLLNKALGRYSSGSLTYLMPGNWPNRSSEVDEIAKSFLAHYSTAKWYELNGTGDRFINDANEMLVELSNILGKRNKPERK